MTRDSDLKPLERLEPLLGVSVMLAWWWALASQGTVSTVPWLPHVALYSSTLAAACAAWARARSSGLSQAAVLLAMASLTWDLWWHQAYPGPVTLATIPHLLLAVSGLCALLHWGRATRRTDLIVMLVDGLILLWWALMANEYLGWPQLWHGSEFYIVSGLLFPGWLVVAGRRRAWGATMSASLYLAVAALGAALSGSLPQTPLLLVGPALVVDLGLRSAPGEGRPAAVTLLWALALGGAATLASLVLHWPVSTMILDGSDIWRSIGMPVAPSSDSSWTDRFWTIDFSTRRFVAGLAVASVLAALSILAGRAWAAEPREDSPKG